MDAIIIYTWNGAYPSKDEDKLGSIARADLIVLDKDILTVDPEDVKEIQVLTIMRACSLQ